MENAIFNQGGCLCQLFFVNLYNFQLKKIIIYVYKNTQRLLKLYVMYREFFMINESDKHWKTDYYDR